MIDLAMRTKPPVKRDQLSSLNLNIGQAVCRSSLMELNEEGRRRMESGERLCPPRRSIPEADSRQPSVKGAVPPVPPPSAPNRSAAPIQRQTTSEKTPSPPPIKQAARAMPALIHPLKRGQKTPLPISGPPPALKVCFGWELSDARCEMDASAFLLQETGKVASEDWFVFYGQSSSPDSAVNLEESGQGPDREVLSVDLLRLDPSVKKIVFVLTLHEALERHLNFSMVRNVYLRILRAADGQELLSFAPAEGLDSVTSMTIGELYLHNGQWKFNPVGNGVQMDLAGQCAVYGVEIA